MIEMVAVTYLVGGRRISVDWWLSKGRVEGEKSRKRAAKSLAWLALSQRRSPLTARRATLQRQKSTKNVVGEAKITDWSVLICDSGWLGVSQWSTYILAKRSQKPQDWWPRGARRTTNERVVALQVVSMCVCVCGPISTHYRHTPQYAGWQAGYAGVGACVCVCVNLCRHFDPR